MPVPKLVSTIFPNLADRRWGNLNLDTFSKEFRDRDPNPLLDPEFCQSWLDYIHLAHQVDYSYGGYAEDRSNLWRGQYMMPKYPIHLGLDINASEGQTVHAALPGEVVHVWKDPDQKGGWGGRVIVQVAPREYVIYAHLHPLSLTAHQQIKAGDPVGTIGDHTVNGGWFPHLHVQRVKDRHWNKLDGYGNQEDLALCPDPLLLVEDPT